MLIKLPFYAKTTLIFIGIYITISMLHIGESLVLPLIFGAIIAILLHPMVMFFERLKMNRIIAILMSLVISFILIGVFALFMISQMSLFRDSWPIFVERFGTIINDTINWVPKYFDISAVKVQDWIAETKTKVLDSSSAVIGQTLLSVGNTMALAFLVPIYVFLFLFYKPLILNFVHQLFDNDKQGKVNIIIRQTKSVIQQYLVGLLIETAIMAVLNSVALLLLGIDYAILIGILGALLNLIPYIGGLVAVAIPVMIAIVTKDSSWYVLYVVAAYYSIQLFDNNFIVPKIVASKVRINALVSIVIVLMGGALWGIAGMFLSIPLIAILKVIFDHVEPLRPWGTLLGDQMPKPIAFKLFKKKKC